MSDYKAIHKYARISPQKARLVADLIRNKDAESAVTTLDFTLKKAAPIIKKVLKSAIANAENNGALDAESLRIKKIFVDDGPTMKRFRAAAKGRAAPILKRTSHITVIVTNGGK